jgi:hypothetical protein
VPGRAARLFLRSVAVAVVSTAALPARAQTLAGAAANPGSAALELSWDGPADCQRGEAVRAKVLRLLGHRPAPSLRVSITVRREAASRYVARLVTATDKGAGSKRLEGESCDAVALASSVVIALSIDPDASLDAEVPELPVEERSSPQPSSDLPAPAPAPAPARPAPRATEPRETWPYLHGSVGVLFGLLGNPSALVSAGVGVRRRRVSLELAFAVYQSRDVALAGRSAAGAELSSFSTELCGCYAALPFELGSIEACPGARVESLSARSFGVSNPDEAQVLLLSGLALLRGRLQATSRLSATLDFGLAVRPFHPTFVLIGVGDVFEVPLFSPFARTGLVLEF